MMRKHPNKHTSLTQNYTSPPKGFSTFDIDIDIDTDVNSDHTDDEKTMKRNQNKDESSCLGLPQNSRMTSRTYHPKRSSIIKSINRLGRHVPRCVVNDLSKEVSRLERSEQPMLVLPYARTYRAALLLIDMSGFTKLSLLLDVESLSKVSY